MTPRSPSKFLRPAKPGNAKISVTTPGGTTASDKNFTVVTQTDNTAPKPN
jgi:hypothetical protein